VASLLTGLFPGQHTVESRDAALPPAVDYAPEILGKHGLATAAFVGNGYISRLYGFARGWQTWQTFASAGGGNRARHIVDAASRWLHSLPANQRFFAYLHLVDPHAPYSAPSHFRHRYVQRRYRGGFLPQLTANLVREHSAGLFTLLRRDRQWLEELYDGEVSYSDFHLGRLLDTLKRTGLARDTLVVVTADHGEEFLDHGHLGHGYTVFEELVHVPLLIHTPGGRAPLRIEREVGLTDVLPTACDLLGLQCTPQLAGRSLTAALAGAASAGSGLSFSAAAGAGLSAVRSARFKLICRGADCRLFDLELDPGETTALGTDHSIARAALRDALGDHLGRVQATGGRKTTDSLVKHQGREAAMDSETRRQLQALGYLAN
jgi:arylsulfatase A-like enzyme